MRAIMCGAAAAAADRCLLSSRLKRDAILAVASVTVAAQHCSTDTRRPATRIRCLWMDYSRVTFLLPGHSRRPTAAI